MTKCPRAGSSPAGIAAVPCTNPAASTARNAAGNAPTGNGWGRRRRLPHPSEQPAGMPAFRRGRLHRPFTGAMPGAAPLRQHNRCRQVRRHVRPRGSS
jgi:hypothetical protein